MAINSTQTFWDSSLNEGVLPVYVDYGNYCDIYAPAGKFGAKNENGATDGSVVLATVNLSTDKNAVKKVIDGMVPWKWYAMELRSGQSDPMPAAVAATFKYNGGEQVPWVTYEAGEYTGDYWYARVELDAGYAYRIGVMANDPDGIHDYVKFWLQQEASHALPQPQFYPGSFNVSCERVLDRGDGDLERTGFFTNEATTRKTGTVDVAGATAFDLDLGLVAVYGGNFNTVDANARVDDANGYSLQNTISFNFEAYPIFRLDLDAVIAALAAATDAPSATSLSKLTVQFTMFHGAGTNNARTGQFWSVPSSGDLGTGSHWGDIRPTLASLPAGEFVIKASATNSNVLMDPATLPASIWQSALVARSRSQSAPRWVAFMVEEATTPYHGLMFSSGMSVGSRLSGARAPKVQLTYDNANGLNPTMPEVWPEVGAVTADQMDVCWLLGSDIDATAQGLLSFREITAVAAGGTVSFAGDWTDTPIVAERITLYDWEGSPMSRDRLPSPQSSSSAGCSSVLVVGLDATDLGAGFKDKAWAFRFSVADRVGGLAYHDPANGYARTPVDTEILLLDGTCCWPGNIDALKEEKVSVKSGATDEYGIARRFTGGSVLSVDHKDVWEFADDGRFLRYWNGATGAGTNADGTLTDAKCIKNPKFSIDDSGGDHAVVDITYGNDAGAGNPNAVAHFCFWDATQGEPLDADKNWVKMARQKAAQRFRYNLNGLAHKEQGYDCMGRVVDPDGIFGQTKDESEGGDPEAYKTILIEGHIATSNEPPPDAVAILALGAPGLDGAAGAFSLPLKWDYTNPDGGDSRHWGDYTAEVRVRKTGETAWPQGWEAMATEQDDDGQDGRFYLLKSGLADGTYYDCQFRATCAHLTTGDKTQELEGTDQTVPGTALQTAKYDPAAPTLVQPLGDPGQVLSGPYDITWTFSETSAAKSLQRAEVWAYDGEDPGSGTPNQAWKNLTGAAGLAAGTELLNYNFGQLAPSKYARVAVRSLIAGAKPSAWAVSGVFGTETTVPAGPPTALSPNGPPARRSSEPITFAWRHNGPVGSQSRAILHVKDSAHAEPQDTEVLGHYATKTFDAGSLALGRVSWSVTTYQVGGGQEMSATSATVSFDVVLGGNGCTILSPLDDAVLTGTGLSVGWDTDEASDQIAYRGRLVDLEHPATDQWNSGEVVSGNARQLNVLNALSDGHEYAFYLAVKDSQGSWSDEDSVTFSVSWTKPAIPTLTAIARPGNRDILLEGYAGEGGDAETVRMELCRVDRGTGDYVVIDPDFSQAYADACSWAAEPAYYFLIAWSTEDSTGSYACSNLAGDTLWLPFGSEFIDAADGPTPETAATKESVVFDALDGVSRTPRRNVTVNEYAGRDYGVATYGDGKGEEFGIDGTLYTVADRRTLNRLLDLDHPVLYRSQREDRCFVAIELDESQSMDTDDWSSFSVRATRVGLEEGEVRSDVQRLGIPNIGSYWTQTRGVV